MKIAIYFTHHESLGHTTRIINIIDGLKKYFNKRVDILILHNGKRQQFNLKKYGKVIDLPYATGKEYFNKLNLVHKLFTMNESIGNVLKSRLRLIKNSLKNFKPDIFITEYFPLGKEIWSGIELPVILKFIKKEFNPKIIGSVGYPSYHENSYDLIKNYYDLILLHCTKFDAKFFTSTLKSQYISPYIFDSILKDFAEKIKFTGYIIKKNKLRDKEKIRTQLGMNEGQKLVVVSRGGGVIYPKIITSSLLAAKKSEDFFLISTGPATSKDDFFIYKAFARKLKNVMVTHYLPNFKDYLNAANLSVNMAGYNTVTELLWLRKQNICVPSEGIEQIYRANMMDEFNLCKTLNYKVLSKNVILEEIEHLTSSPLKPKENIKELNFDGIENTIKIIEKLF